MEKNPLPCPAYMPRLKHTFTMARKRVNVFLYLSDDPYSHTVELLRRTQDKHREVVLVPCNTGPCDNGQCI